MKYTIFYVNAFIAVFFVLTTGLPVRAGSLTPGNILVSTENFGGSLSNSVFEYTTSGTRVQQFAVPYPGGRPGTEDVRGIAANAAGQVQILQRHLYAVPDNPDTDSRRRPGGGHLHE